MKTKTPKRHFAYQYTTTGEALYDFLRNWLFEGIPTDHMCEWLDRIEYEGDLWHEYIEQMITVWLTGRLIAAGRSYKEQFGDLYDDQLRSYAHEYLVMPKVTLNRLVRLSVAAVDASERNMSRGLKNRLRTWAEERHSHCYICGVTLTFHIRDQNDSFTRDHVWPQSYGGDSTLENLLPACRKCNAVRKAHYATWSATSIQSLILKMAPSSNDWNNLQGAHYYGLHHYAGQKYAIHHATSMKNAFLQLGPWVHPPQVRDTNDVPHFFNLANHLLTLED